MNAVFFDRQDGANALNGTTLRNAGAAREIVEQHKERTPFLAELVGENGYKLLLGLGSAEGCVQFSATDGSPPYLMAVGRSDENEGELEFLIGDTPTPIPRRYLLSMNQVSEIAADFVHTGERAPHVVWEEI